LSSTSAWGAQPSNDTQAVLYIAAKYVHLAIMGLVECDDVMAEPFNGREKRKKIWNVGFKRVDILFPNNTPLCFSILGLQDSSNFPSLNQMVIQKCCSII